MSQQAYVGLTKRTFGQALVHLLESDYALLGSRRVLDLVAHDVEVLVDQFYPPPQRLKSGWLVFTGTKADGHKAYPGDQAKDYQLVTLAWPVLTPQDRQQLASQFAWLIFNSPDLICSKTRGSSLFIFFASET